MEIAQDSAAAGQEVLYLTFTRKGALLGFRTGCVCDLDYRGSCSESQDMQQGPQQGADRMEWLNGKHWQAMVHDGKLMQSNSA